MNLTDISKRRCTYMANSKDKSKDTEIKKQQANMQSDAVEMSGWTDKSTGTKITYSVPDETFSGSWAPAADSYTVSYADHEGTQMDFNEMLRADAGKGMENMTFEDWNDPIPFENSVPSLEKIDDVCKDYPSLKIAYEKFKNVWRICYEDYRTNNKELND